MTAARMTSGRALGARSEGLRRDGLRRDGAWPWLFVMPLLTGVTVFYLYPIVATLWMSLTKTGEFGRGSRFVGPANYETLVTDPKLLGALGNTLTFTGIVLLGVPISVLLAALISRPGLRFAKVYRVLYFMPYVAMPVAVAIVWKMIFNGEYGILNYALRSMGVANPPYWLSTPGVALIAVSILGLWSSIGFNMIIISAGLKSIPVELYEAADLDGASPTRQFFSITVPLLTPSIFFLSVMTGIGGFQLFDTIFVLISPMSPAMPSTKSLVYLFYQEAFVNGNRGYGAAIAVFVMALIGLVTIIQFRLQRRWVTYV
ncbi:MAG: sugar ABC transporter permease [Micropruina sp.]|nr:sugar ABC transporter permease [Micropruina sp.]